MQGHFNLRLWFILTSFGAILIIFVLFAIGVSQFMTRALIERETEVSQEFLESMMPSDRAAVFATPGASANPALAVFVEHLFTLPGIIRANIYSADQIVVWSTDKSIVGRRFEVNDELERALAGARVTEVGWLPDRSKPEHATLSEKFSGRYIEAYIPIRAKDEGKVLGVIEFYKLPEALNATILRGQYLIWVWAAAAASILFVTLYWIVQRGAQIIEGQQRDISQMEVLAAVGQMSSAVAHSLRNPMATIRSSAELWKAEQSHQADTSIADDIIQQIDRMDKHVRDLLNYSRSSSHELRPVDPVIVVKRHMPAAIVAGRPSKIEVSFVDSRRHPRPVMADELLLGQALTSIFTNAVEAMPQGGMLSVSISDKNPGIVEIDIRDNGCGIPPDQIGRVAQSQFTTKRHGYGLGLMLSQRIIEKFSGTIDIESEPARGTVVSIKLKAA